jgi:PKD repeat protein
VKRYIFIVNFLLFTLQGFSQKETAWWFFGYKTGLHFQTNTVTTLPGVSSLNGTYGFSNMADSAGNLLFYSDFSKTVFNKLHDTMPNGVNLGGATGPQPSLIMRKSGSLYYLLRYSPFNYNIPGIPPMLSYSIIDMSLASGNGSVTSTNIPITSSGIVFAKMAGTRHCNGEDYWLLTHRADMPNGSNQFYAYHVSAGGIGANPVISSIGSNQPHHYANQVQFGGRMKFSPNGKKVCSVYPYRTVELYDFDNGTGQLTNVMKLDSNSVPTSSAMPIAYDVEFSPDGSKLYVSYTYGQHPVLCQFDLTAGTPQAISNSKTVLDSAFNNYVGDLQLGMDGKIYFGKKSSTNLSLIHNPNLVGLACNYDSVGINMGIIPATTVQAAQNGGLPSFVSSYFEKKPSFPPFTYTATCGLISFYSPTVTAFPATGYSVSSYQWIFGDPVTGSSNTSTLSNPTHVFSSNGSYQIKLLVNYKCGTDTLKQTVNVSGLPSLSITGKPSICQGETQILNFSGVGTYSLNGNPVTQASASIQPTTNTVYTVSGFDSSTGCHVLKTFTVTVKPCTGIYEVEKTDWLIGVYPNPHQHEVTVELISSAQAILMDYTGRVIKQEELVAGKNTMKLNNTASGIYFLRLVSAKSSITLKLVKE